MEQESLTFRQKEILSLISMGYCLPREIAFQLKANKTNVSTALKYLLDNEYVVREKFFGTYVYGLNKEMLCDLLQKKSKAYKKQMEMEKDIFTRRARMFDGCKVR